MTGVASEAAGDPAALLVGFARRVRAAGAEVSGERMRAFLRATEALRPWVRTDVYWAGRLTLCGGPDDVARYDREFAAWFGAGERAVPRPPVPAPPRLRPVPRNAALPTGRPGVPEERAPRLPASAASTDVLRHRDVAELSAAEREQVRRLLAALALRGPVRRTARRRPARRGETDPRRTVRAMLRNGGEPVRLRHRMRAERPRRVVLLVDVSGSMAPYADALLRFAHAAARGGHTEVFTVGTRLTRVTRAMAHRDPDAAMAAVARAVPDWRGGTRLGELLEEFLDRWGAARDGPRGGGGAAVGRLGAWRSRAARRGDATLAPARAPRDLGQSAEGAARLRAPRGRDGGGAAERGRVRRGAQPRRAGAAGGRGAGRPPAGGHAPGRSG
ncbi:hypothetical protein SUDANB54_00366 [Streptomyces sp. enrichment culture]